MESDRRKKALIDWLHSIQLPPIQLHPMPGDASMRRYFRLHTLNTTFVVMDAPPPVENCHPFIAIAETLRGQGLYAPEIYAADVARGFLVLTDFGDLTLLRALSQDANQAYTGDYYEAALDALATLQTCRNISNWTVPAFTATLMQQEWNGYKEWFLNQWLQLSYVAYESALDDCYQRLIESALTQPQVFMHRDYHAANLMLLSDGNIGVLDFQDAFMGPLTYDLASLLRDGYIDWPQIDVERWVRSYYQRLRHLDMLHDTSFDTFLQWFDLMGVQRHLKILMTFARKYKRDANAHYLQYMPRTMRYLETITSQYTLLAPLHDFILNGVKPICEERLSCVA